MPDRLVGTWSAQSLTADAQTTTTIPLQNTMVVTETDLDITGTNFDYDVTFTETGFTAGGEYDLNFVASSGGVEVLNQTNSYANVTTTGTYTATNDEITTNGQLFSLEFNGQELSGSDAPQVASYSINGNILTVTQSTNQMITDPMTGLPTAVSSNSTSTWLRN